MITVIGKCGIKATVLADSISEMGVRMLTFEIEYPRLVLAEFNTHRALSRNSFSSRAVPFEKMLGNLTGRPVRFGANQGGMQDKGEDYDEILLIPTYGAACDGGYVNALYVEEDMAYEAEEAWEEAKDQAIRVAKAFKEAGYHKQVYNRLLEPFQMMKTIVSGTEWGNFFWLRDDEMTDPTLAELARCMREAKDASKSVLLHSGDWHLPYVDFFQEVVGYTKDDESIYGPQQFYIGNLQMVDGEVDPGFALLTLEQAIKVSCARCAAVSYRNEDYGLEKSKELYERLVGAEKKHASALEHCATPMNEAYEDHGWGSDEDESCNITEYPSTWEKGISHMDRTGQLWSGNLRGFIQHRKTIDGENYE